MSTPRETVRPLLRTRQIREFTQEPLTKAELDAIVDAARWSGSSSNSQPGGADADHALSHAYDEGRAAERMLVAASMLGLGAGIAWIRSVPLEAIRPLLGLPADRIIRTVIALGHPSQAARRPKSAPGEGRLPREEVVFEERWPEGRT